MQSVRKLIGSLFLIIVMVFVFSGCAPQAGAEQDAENTDAATGEDSVTLVLAAYTTTREAYAEIIPLFQEYWLETHAQVVNFEESYEGSGAQARAVEGGFEADVVALALENDVNRLVNVDLVS